jgi:hypothetical protein
VFAAYSRKYETSTARVFMVHNNNITNRIDMAVDDDSDPLWTIVGGGSVQANIVGTETFSSATVRQVGAYAADDYIMYFNGSVSGTPDTSGSTLPSGLAAFNVGSYYNETLHLNGLIEEIAYWDERLDNAILDGLSDETLAVSAAGGSLVLRRNRIMKRRAKARRLGAIRIRNGRRMDY